MKKNSPDLLELFFSTHLPSNFESTRAFLDTINNIYSLKNEFNALKVNSLAAHIETLIEEGSVIEKEDISFRNLSNKKIRNLFLSAIFPMAIGYLSENNTALFCGIILGMTILSYGIYKGFSKEAEIITSKSKYGTSIVNFFVTSSKQDYKLCEQQIERQEQLLIKKYS